MRRPRFDFSAITLVLLISGCASVTPLPDGPIMDVTWQLVEVAGNAVGNGANGSRATLRLGSDSRAGGYAGCNQYGGEFSIDGSTISFGQLAMTRMYCEGFMDLERSFSQALDQTRGWRVADDHLELLGDGRVLARLTRS